jgi:hypothetical protein
MPDTWITEPDPSNPDRTITRPWSHEDSPGYAARYFEAQEQSAIGLAEEPEHGYTGWRAVGFIALWMVGLFILMVIFAAILHATGHA